MMPHPPPNGTQVIGVFISRDMFKELLKLSGKNDTTIGEAAKNLMLDGLEYQREKRRRK